MSDIHAPPIDPSLPAILPPKPKYIPVPPKEHQFKKGAPGRPKGSRNAISGDFLAALHADFKKHGADAIAGARAESPLGYCKIIAALLPNRHEVKVDATSVSDAELLAIASEAIRTIEHDEADAEAGAADAPARLPSLLPPPGSAD